MLFPVYSHETKCLKARGCQCSVFDRGTPSKSRTSPLNAAADRMNGRNAPYAEVFRRSGQKQRWRQSSDFFLSDQSTPAPADPIHQNEPQQHEFPVNVYPIPQPSKDNGDKIMSKLQEELAHMQTLAKEQLAILSSQMESLDVDALSIKGAELAHQILSKAESLSGRLDSLAHQTASSLQTELHLLMREAQDLVVATHRQVTLFLGSPEDSMRTTLIHTAEQMYSLAIESVGRMRLVLEDAWCNVTDTTEIDAGLTQVREYILNSDVSQTVQAKRQLLQKDIYRRKDKIASQISVSIPVVKQHAERASHQVMTSPYTLPSLAGVLLFLGFRIFRNFKAEGVRKCALENQRKLDAAQSIERRKSVRDRYQAALDPEFKGSIDSSIFSAVSRLPSITSTDSVPDSQDGDSLADDRSSDGSAEVKWTAEERQAWNEFEKAIGLDKCKMWEGDADDGIPQIQVDLNRKR